MDPRILREPIPDWGQLPVEQYLIRFWNYSSHESPNEQRKRLVHEYMQLEEIPKEWDPTDFDMHPTEKPTRIPTAEEIDLILRPWRPDDLRRRAWRLWCGRERGPPVVLRTYYDNGEEGDAQFAEYIQASENIDMEANWAALNDRERFNYGANWRQVFGILPEIAGCRETLTRKPVQGIIDICLPDVKGSIADAKKANPQWKENPRLLFMEGQTPLRDMLGALSISWVFIVDEHTFATDELLVVYFDINQDITIKGRLEVNQGDIDSILLNREQGSPEGIVINQGRVGDKYLLSTNFGRKFFGLTESDLEESTTVA